MQHIKPDINIDRCKFTLKVKQHVLYIFSFFRSEISQMKKLSRLQAFNSSMALTSGKIVVFATFILLAVMGHQINATKIFTTLALIESLRVSLSMLLPAGILALSDAHATLKRVEVCSSSYSFFQIVSPFIWYVLCFFCYRT